MHIKTLQVRTDDFTLFGDLQFARRDDGLGVRIRITRAKRKTNEKLIGFANVGLDGKLTSCPDDLTDKERALVEAEILLAVDGEPVRKGSKND